MAKDLSSSKHIRLSRAIEEARAAPARDTAVNRTVNVPEATKGIQRSVKFPKPSNALRQYVSAARATAEPVRSVRLRTDLPVPGPGLPAARPIPVRAPPAPKLRRPGPAPAADAEPLLPVRSVVQLGDIVRHARRRQRLTQAELARAAGTGRRFVSDVEGGKTTVEFERLMKLCRVLGIRLFAVGPGDDE